MLTGYILRNPSCTNIFKTITEAMAFKVGERDTAQGWHKLYPNAEAFINADILPKHLPEDWAKYGYQK